MPYCKHQRKHRIPLFPSDGLACADCGYEFPPIGCDERGVRDYWLPGDLWFRRSVDLLKLRWLDGVLGDDVYQCQHCGYAACGLDSFDVLGADDGFVFCPACGLECEAETASGVASQETLKTSGLLF